ncbi:PVC-type heme-binding CxxCH protein [Paludisphaera borealis]|uniref:Cytochrome c domain-containing protein n=1 Tax=Paludisphaera borealis TaxID=1387353 RepID=A0A1U7CSQ3_9BACT|nr:PVC-type heme-binding CxxCH protein [Paludisphaera borealis]APW61961.1 putative beta-propeller-type glycoside hydrolase of unknown function [Paludisphaera borealis]
MTILIGWQSTWGADGPVKARNLKVPEGFTIERIAGPPLVDRPITAAFDEEGRLYVADSSGSNDKVEKQLAEKPHRIVRLEDKDGDGRYESQTVFADKMMFPEGTMWLDGSLYVAAPPSIWKLTDTNGDGVADDRVEWFQGKTLTGCANDLHGPYAGPDGWVYWCKGAFAEQTYERPGKSPFVTKAAHIFRSRPDGSGIEPVMTGGMDNPVDVAFTPGGERIFSTTFFHQPGGGLRDGLAHAIYGGLYGKTNRVLDAPSHKWTSPNLMPVLLHMGPAAPCGLTRYESDALGAEYRDNLFACYFNLHKVGRHVLKPKGATFETKDEDFITSPDLDFHPTDVIEDADGSLIVVDTGGWYKLCCPSSQLSKPDVLGGVYRVRRKDAKPVADPRGLAIDWKTRTPADLVALLGDPRPAVARRAVAALARAGDDARPALVIAMQNRSIQARLNVVWTLARIDDEGARVLGRLALVDPEETVRQAAAHVASLTRDAGAVSALTALLKGDSTANRRVAAEALGRIGDRTVVPILLDAIHESSDPILTHSLTYALIDIADPKGTAEGLKSPNVAVKKAALTAIDQMDGGGLDPKLAVALLTDANPDLKETASWIVGRHPEWAETVAGFFQGQLKSGDLSEADRAALERQLARFGGTPAVQKLLTETLLAHGTEVGNGGKRIALKAVAQSGLKDAPAAWISALAAILAGPDADLARQAVSTARALAVPADKGAALTAPLLAIAGRESAPADARLEALAAVPGGLPKIDPPAFAFLLGRLDPANSVATRVLAAEVITMAKLDASQLGALAESLRKAGPLEVDRLLAAFDAATDDALGVRLVKTLGESSAIGSLRIDALKLHLAKFGPETRKAAEGLYARLNADAAKQNARVDALLAKVAEGDVRRGQLVFHGEKAACFTCHAIGYRGGDVGPDLTKVGGVRSERDLLEAIVYPSASLIRSFEPVVLATTDGKVINGLLRNETSDELVLITGANQQTRVARADVEEIRPSTVSIMPAGLDQQLTTQELVDLVAFLKACK